MLSQEEQRAIEAELAHYEFKRAACVDALKIVQEHRGWVSDEALHDVAAFLEVDPAELENVSTFYSVIFRRPAGRHVIRICDSVSCWVMGSDSLCGYLERRLAIKMGETSADGRFTLLPNACLGCCDHAPVMMIDRELHLDLTAEKIEAILNGYT